MRPYRFRPLAYFIGKFRGRKNVAILGKFPRFLTRNRQFFASFSQIRCDSQRNRKDQLKTAASMGAFARPIVGNLRPIGPGLERGSSVLATIVLLLE